MLYTIGYESKNIDDLISQLKSHNISTLVDVREIPISRKKGFSKTVFSDRVLVVAYTFDDWRCYDYINNDYTDFYTKYDF